MKRNIDDLIEERLIEGYNKYYRLAYSYVKNEADAKDIVQEGAYKAILKSDTIKNIEYIDTWIYRVMINEALSFIRKNKYKYEELTEVSQISSDSYENIDLKRSIENLKEPDKTILKLRYFEDMKIEQIAEVINENVNTVKSRLYRTLKSLCLSLE